MRRVAMIAAGLIACTASAAQADDARPAVTGPALVTGFVHLCGSQTDFDDAEMLAEYGYAPVDPKEEHGYYSGGIQGQIISRGEGHERIRIAQFRGHKCQAWAFGDNRIAAWEHLKNQLVLNYGFAVVEERGTYTRLETEPRDGRLVRIHVSSTEGTIPSVSINDEIVTIDEE